MMQPNGYDAEEARRRYVSAWNNTMINIWRDRMVKTGAIDTGALYSSVTALRLDADSRFTEVSIIHGFNRYGIYVDAGVGREVYRGNGGDIGRAKVRRAKPWFSTKYYSSIRNLQDFYADNLGADCANAISKVLAAP